MSVQGTMQKEKLEPQYQAAVKSFEAAARYFQKQNYEKAKEIFEKLAEAPILEIAARARVHLRICQKRIHANGPAPKGTVDFYALGVAELNARRPDLAIEHLNKADKITPKREHIHYALAAAYALRGNAEQALEHLKEAISIRPESRVQARRDEDFASLASDPRFRRLVSPGADRTS